jgi:hypothetical protein
MSPSDERRLVLHETVLPDGASEKTWLEVVDGALVMGVEGGFEVEVPLPIFEAVMQRYGKPLAEGIDPIGPTLELLGGQVLSLFRHRARYDVIAKDFLVYRAPGREPLAELATSVSGALAYLAGLGQDPR